MQNRLGYMCAELLELMVQQIVVRIGLAEPFRPQTLFGVLGELVEYSRYSMVFGQLAILLDQQFRNSTLKLSNFNWL